MTAPVRVALAQVNPTVGDIDGNARLILESIQRAQGERCDLIVFPEMCLTGYPPEDLLLKPAFVADNVRVLNHLAKRIHGIAAVIGFVDSAKLIRSNAAAWIEQGRIKAVYRKQCLPNYGVFDEQRYFTPGHQTVVRPLKGLRFGLTICEDIWVIGPHLAELKKQRPDVVINISASPFHVGKLAERHREFRKTVKATGAPLLYCNTAGGQDELVFDGGSFAMSAKGSVPVQFPLFKEGLHVIELQKAKPGLALRTNEKPVPELSQLEEIHRALIVGTRDYVHKNGFKKVALGISGGIDSAVVAALAAEALGPQNVIGVTMPTRFNLEETISDAANVAKNLGIEFHEIPIQPIFTEYLKAFAPLFGDSKPGLAEENLQARIRGSILMTLSNKFGWLILTTGNKSELSTGYSTLYGDTAGGFAMIKDVLKTTVYDLARLINERSGREIIPQTTIDRAPTAELRENQKDEDSLGAYKDLDPIIVAYVEKNQPIGQTGAYAKKIVSMIDHAEYKRRQNPPGVKITPRSFGRDHRMPITNRYRSS